MRIGGMRSVTRVTPVLLALLLCGNVLGQQLNFAVDFPGNPQTTIYNCLRGFASLIFLRCYAPDSGGVVDPGAPQNIQLANIAGFNIEVYLAPNAVNPDVHTAVQQVDEAFFGLYNAGITVRSMWLQVTNVNTWTSDKAKNALFITQAVTRMKQRGITPGIYTNSDDWTNIAGAVNADSGVSLWYWNVTAPGLFGETISDYSDFTAFAGFTTPVAKQYGKAESLCLVEVNRDVYTSSIFPASRSPPRLLFEVEKEEGQIVVGGNVMML